MKLALLIFILIGCAQNNKSVVQTLDNLTRAPDKDIQWNQCSGTNTTGEADYKIDVTGIPEADRTTAKAEVIKALSAVPERKLKKNFFKIGKIKILSPTDVEKKCAAGISDATLQSITEQGQQSGPRFCWQLEDDSTITANLSSDPQDIHHHTVKMFGYLVTQIYVKYAENFPPSERLFWLAEKFKEGRRLVFLGFIEDLETKKAKSRLNDVEKKYYNDFKTALKTSTCTDLEDLENLIYAESFDSYYCTTKTKNSMKTNFSYVYNIFDRQQQGITDDTSTNFSVNLIKSKYKPVLKSCILSKQQEAAQAKAIELAKQEAANADKVMANNTPTSPSIPLPTSQTNSSLKTTNNLPTNMMSANPVAQTYTQTSAQVAAANAAAQQTAAAKAATAQQRAATNNNPLTSIQGVLSNPLVSNILKSTGLDKQLGAITNLLGNPSSAISSVLPGILGTSNPTSVANNLPFTPLNPNSAFNGATPSFIDPRSIDPTKITTFNPSSTIGNLNTGFDPTKGSTLLNGAPTTSIGNLSSATPINPNTLINPTSLNPSTNGLSVSNINPNTFTNPTSTNSSLFSNIDSFNPTTFDPAQFDVVNASFADFSLGDIGFDPTEMNDIFDFVDNGTLSFDTPFSQDLAADLAFDPAKDASSSFNPDNF
jgi:hypothetical protein